MKDFFEDFNWEQAIGMTLSLLAAALAILGLTFSIVFVSAWYLLLWIPAILCVAIVAGKEWFE